MAVVASISQQIWDMKYRLRGASGEPLDKTIEDTWQRVATALAARERDPALWTDRFYEAMTDFKFLPAGRVVAGAGSSRSVTLSNCFVMGTIPDDMGGIFAHLREAALTMQQGGGIGYDLSTLRPRGAYVKGVGADASGPLSFMDVWDAMCRTIMSAGYRRGAMMATLSCEHPDIEAFIEAKAEPGRLRMFNLSVLVTDAFMQAVAEDAPWQLSFGGTVAKVLPARELWDKIMRATYAYAEPGVIFIDRINRLNNLYYCEKISATNPCLTADTGIHPPAGPRQIAEPSDRPAVATADGNARERDARGYLLGLLLGDGTLRADKAILSGWPGRSCINGGYERPGVGAVMTAAHDAARQLPHRSDFVGWIDVPGRGEYRLALGALRRLALD